MIGRTGLLDRKTLTKAQIEDVSNTQVSEELWSEKEELVELTLLIGLYTSVSTVVALARPEPGTCTCFACGLYRSIAARQLTMASVRL